jgi:two-component system, OmpR family, sensor kinase
VSNDRLTRHEISWLLAQEARGAAKALRSELRGPGTSEAKPSTAPVETTLDALDDAIDMLSQLNTGARGKGRRGRIDLAALLYDVAPNARISIEPGAGTEVFGDEADLRRMLNLLVSQANSSSGSAPSAETEVTIRRQGDWVRISVELGPDTSATGELERRWLSRNAVRHGGWVELEGGTQSIYLQADGASDRREVTELRKELEQAQQLGEAYARELAAALVGGEFRTEPPPLRAGDERARFEALQSAAAAMQRPLKALLDGWKSDLAELSGQPGAAELTQKLGARSSHAQDLVNELGAIAECPEETHEAVELVSTLNEAVTRIEQRAARDGVECLVDAPPSLWLNERRRLLALLLDCALAHAVSATPKGGQVQVNVFNTELGVIVSFADGGTAIPEALRVDVIRHRVDPGRLGRPAGIALVAADAIAGALGAGLELKDGVGGQPELWITLRKRASIPAAGA